MGLLLDFPVFPHTKLRLREAPQEPPADFPVKPRIMEEEEEEEGLPALLLERLLARGVRDARDAAALAGSCRRLRAAVGGAPLRLRVAPSRGRRADDRYLLAVASRFPNAAELELLEAAVSEDAVVEALGALPDLGGLHVRGCHKIGARLGQALARAPPGVCPARISIVQCFRMTWALLGGLLRLNFRSGSILRVAAVSHLDLSACGVGRDGLLEICGEGDAEGRDEDGRGAGAGEPAAAGDRGGSLRGLGMHNCNQLEPRLLRCLVNRLPRLEALFLGGATLVDTAGRFACGFDVLSEVVRLLPHLRVLELTFFPVETVAAARGAAAQEAHRPIMVWDFTEGKSVLAAGAFLRGLAQEECLAPQGRHRHSSSMQLEDWCNLARNAASCSSTRQIRPMHEAACRGRLPVVHGLLELGAPPDAKDRHGATPLFRAAYRGHCRIARALLAGGANCMVLNAAEETPLYIASLRGHLTVVQLIIAHCSDSGILWWENHRYGDGWNPLMAAVLANNPTIVSVLLAENAAVSSLVAATNRYGQTALHIACRAGSEALVAVLLRAGSDPHIRDTYGRTPLKVATKGGHGHLKGLLPPANGK